MWQVTDFLTTSNPKLNYISFLDTAMGVPLKEITDAAPKFVDIVHEYCTTSFK